LPAAYVGDAGAAFKIKWRGIATDLASSLASGEAPDDSQMSNIKTAGRLLTAVRRGGAVDAMLPAMPYVRRWIDLDVSPDDLARILAPYRAATAAAIAGFNADDPAPVAAWSTMEQSYGPLTKLLSRDAIYVRPCESLPDGIPGGAARLLTPLDHQPFEAERTLAAIVPVWSRCLQTGDQESADAVAYDLAKRLNSLDSQP
jgi:hypothetical protein